MHKYEELVNNLLTLIEKNVQNDELKLPTEAAIGASYGVSRQTVRRAMDELVEKGYIVRQQGSGNYATGLLPSSVKNRIAVILANDYDYEYPEIINQISKQAPRGFSISFYYTEGLAIKEKYILEDLLPSPPRHLFIEAIASGLPSLNRDLINEFIKYGTKLHFIEDAYPGFGQFSNHSESIFELSRLCTKELFQKNYSEISCILPADQRSGEDAYLGIMKEYSLVYNAINNSDDGASHNLEENIFWYTNRDLFNLRKKQDLRFLSDFVERKASSCSAIICYSDEIAYWLVRLLYRRNSNTSSDILVICLKDTRLSYSGLGFSFSPELSWSTAHGFLEDKAKVVRIPKSYF